MEGKLNPIESVLRRIEERVARWREEQLLTVGLVGYDGGRIVGERLADYAVVVRSDYIPRIQEVQASVYHVLRVLVEDLVWERN